MKISKILQETLNNRIEVISGKMSQSVMARKFPDFSYSLQYGFLTWVPLNLIKGLDPTPASWVDDEGYEREYEKGEEIPENKPIELIWDFVGDDPNDVNDYEFYMYNGNHRCEQAMLNGDSRILALVQPKNQNLFFKSFKSF